jgi:toxin ParE1/3/4
MVAGGDVPHPSVRRSKLSEDDYRAAWHFIAADNPDAADAFLRKIDAKLNLYAAHPQMGTNRSRLGRGLRSFPVGNYLVFYRIASDGIELVRVLHGARKLKRKMFGP